MFEYIKLWWKVRKATKAWIKQLEETVVEQERYTEENVKAWLEKNDFGLTHSDLQAQCMSSVKKSNSVIKEVKI